MFSLLLLQTISCPPIDFVPRNPVEKAALERAITQCPLLYPESPCLIKFHRSGNQEFRAVCGKPIQTKKSGENP